MAVQVGELFAKLGLDTKEFDSKLEGSGSKLQTAGEHVSKFGSIASGALSTAAGFLAANVISGIGGQVGGLAKQMVSSNAQFEDYGVRFQTLIKNSADFKNATKGVTDPLKLQGLAADAAKQRMKELADFGAKTPFELPGVVEADTILQGFGLHSQESAKKFGYSGKEIRTISGDVASGTGQDFKEIALLMGKFSAGATGEAISRFQELGITSRDELTKMGLQFDKSGQLLSPLPQAMNVVLGLMKNKYGGLMDAQSATFNGMMSNLQDWVAGAIRTIGAPIFDVAKEQLSGFLNILNNLSSSGALDAFAAKLASGVGVALTFLTGTLIPAFVAGWQGISSLISAGVAIWDSVAKQVSTFTGYLNELLFTATPIDAVMAKLSGTFGGLGPYIVGVATAIGGVISAILQGEGVTGDWSTDWEILASVFGEGVADAISRVTEAVWLVMDAFNQLLANAGPIFEQLLGMVQGNGEAFTAFSDLMTSIFGDILGAVISTFVATWTDRLGIMLDTGQQVFNSILSIVQSVFGIIAGFLQAHGAEIVSTLLGAWTAIQQAINVAINAARSIILTVLGVVAAFIKAHGAEIQAILAQAWSTIKTVIDAAVAVIRNIIIPTLTGIANFIKNHSDLILNVLNAAWTAISAVVRGSLSIIQGLVNTVMAIVRGDWAGAWAGIQQILSGAWTAIQGIVKGGIALVQSVIELAWEAIKAITTGVWDAIKGTVTSAVDGIKGAATSAFDGLRDTVIGAMDTLRDRVSGAFSTLRDNLSGIVSGIVSTASSLGSNIIDGIVSGIKNGVGALVGAVQNAAQSALDAAKKLLGIKSPSRVMAREVGRPISQGIAVGIRSGIPAVSSSLIDTMAALRATSRDLIAAQNTGSSYSPQNNYNLSVYTQQSLGSVQAEFDMMRVLAA